MSILSKQETIKEGDIVIAYSNPSCIKPIRITKDATFGNRFGQFHHNSIINKKYGSKIESKNQKSYFYALFPTPELWTRTVPHRTQILYQADISLITMMLEMRPGTVMIEAGTGSGSFSHSIARTIAPNGTLFTFEYNQTRAEICKQEFLEHGISNAIIEHRDVCKDGFGDVGNVDCVFLDLPSPWLALQHAANSFANDRIGKICTFSPCIEQVTTTCAELHKLGFQDIRMFEVLMREHILSSIEVFDLPTGQEYVKKSKKRYFGNKEQAEEGLLASKICDNIRGHTSFLTFANYYPME